LLKNASNESYWLRIEGREELCSVTEAQQRLDVETDRVVEELVRQHQALFSDQADVQRPSDAPPFPIDTDGPPVSVPPGRLDERRRAVLDAKVQDLARRGLIRRTVSPWGARPLLVWEAAKDRWRLCIDYRRLNAKTAPVTPSLPHISDVWASLAGCTRFSSLDLAEGFWQLQVRECDQAKTAFYASGCKWEWTVVPFGLKNAPSYMQELMNLVCAEVNARMKLDGIPGVVWCWLDDVLLATRGDDAAHHRALAILFEVSLKHGLRYKLSKCTLAKPQVEWVGFMVSQQGRRVAMQRVCLEDWPVPTSRKDIQVLAGWANWAAQDLPGLSGLLAPFYAALKAQHTPDLSAEMESLRRALVVEDDWLAFPEPGSPFELHVDTSRQGIGASLFQNNKPVAHVSHALRPCESRWPARDLEMHGVCWSLKRFAFLRGSPVTVFVDHESLSETVTPPTASPTSSFYSQQRWGRWVELLLSFDVRFQYRSGAEMQVGPDFLSRLPPASACEECSCWLASRKARSWGEVAAALRHMRAQQGSHGAE